MLLGSECGNERNSIFFESVDINFDCGQTSPVLLSIINKDTSHRDAVRINNTPLTNISAMKIIGITN